MESILICLARINRLRSYLLNVKTVLGGVINAKNYKRHITNENAKGDTNSRLQHSTANETTEFMYNTLGKCFILTQADYINTHDNV